MAEISEEEKKIAKMATKRKKVAMEILQTEQLYVARLQNIVTLFFDPLINHATNDEKKIISVEDVKTIFGNVKVILGYNIILLGNLTERLNVPSSDYCVGDIFYRLAEFLKTYSEYCKNYPRSLSVIKKYREIADFENLYLSLHDKSTLGDATLKDLLIIPVQRIPRYKLLLEEMMKCTVETHPDYEFLSKALEKITIIATKNEQSQEKYANVSKIVQIQSEFGKKEGNAMKLLQPDRLFIRQVIVDFQEGSSPVAKGRKMILFNDLILIAKIKDEKDKKKSTLKLQKNFDLFAVEHLATSDNNPTLNFEFQHHHYIITFENKNTRDSVHREINSNLEKLKSSNKNSNNKVEDKPEKKERESKKKFLKKSVSKKSLTDVPVNRVDNPLWLQKKKTDSLGASRRHSIFAAKPPSFHDLDTEIKKSSSMNFIIEESPNSSSEDLISRSKSYATMPDSNN